MARVREMYSLKEELNKADEQLQNSPSLLGMTMLTYPNYINAMRSTMFTAHLKQFVNLTNPDFPTLFTNTENMVGKYSRFYKEAGSNLKVIKKIVKFGDILDNPTSYLLFVYDEDSDTYDVIARNVCEDLTENFGFDYNNDVIDNIKEGDTIKKGTVIYRSKSYDEDMNYAYGKNINVAYTLDPFTSEDAAIGSRSLMNKLTSVESEVITIGLNNNDYLINLFGDDKKYQPLPYIGQKVSNIIAVSRMQINEQLLYDFKDKSLRKIIEGDNIFYIDTDVEVIDYTIYNNNEDIPNSPFYAQIKKMLHSQQRYYTAISELTHTIADSGSNYSQDIEYLMKRADEMLDTKKKWASTDRSFSNMEIEMHIRREAPLAKGCKIVGRYGNKSVVSQIREDEDMPYTKDGRRIDLLINLLAIINRTTAAVIFELFINGCSYQIQQRMKELKTTEERANLLFEYLYAFNKETADISYRNYQKKSDKNKEKYIEDAMYNDIYINIVPLWEDRALFYKCIEVLHKFDFLKEDDLYIRKWGREIKCLNKTWVGQMYTLKLKQTDRRGFSARSTGAVDPTNLPTRSYRSRSHLEQYSTTCIRFGEFESLNFTIAMPALDIVLFHALYRTSIKGRKDIASSMFLDTDDEDGFDALIDNSYTSRVAEKFQVILKCLGIRLDFDNDDESIMPLDNVVVSRHVLDDTNYMCTDYQFFILERMAEIREEILDENPILTTEILQKEIERVFRERTYINGSLKDELKMLKMYPSLAKKGEQQLAKEEKAKSKKKNKEEVAE